MQHHSAVNWMNVQVVHVSPDLRKAYIGHASDTTAQGKSIMAYNKSWRSLPIQSWSGGVKIAGQYCSSHSTKVFTHSAYRNRTGVVLPWRTLFHGSSLLSLFHQLQLLVVCLAERCLEWQI